MSGVSNRNEYLVVYEKTSTGYSTTGTTLPDTKKNMQEAISGHLAVMREFGDPIPQPTTVAEPMQVPA